MNAATPYIALVRLSDGQQLFRVNVPGYITSNDGNTLAWSPDSAYLAWPDGFNWSGGTSWKADIWERATFQQISSFGGVLPSTDEASNIKSLTWSPDGQQIVTVVNNLLWLSQFGSQQPAVSFATTTQDALIASPVWSPNGQFVAALASLPPSSLVVWEASTGQAMPVTGNGSQNNLEACAWLADNKSLIAVDNSNVLSSWTIG